MNYFLASPSFDARLVPFCEFNESMVLGKNIKLQRMLVVLAIRNTWFVWVCRFGFISICIPFLKGRISNGNLVLIFFGNFLRLFFSGLLFFLSVFEKFEF